jgi:hypothetical protein
VTRHETDRQNRMEWVELRKLDTSPFSFLTPCKNRRTHLIQKEDAENKG